jgi:hypothetical protein
MGSYDMHDKARDEVLRFHGIVAGYKIHHFHQSVHHYPQGVASFSSWQSGDEIHRDRVLWPVWWYEQFQQTEWYISYWLDLFAGVTIIYISVDVFLLVCVRRAEGCRTEQALCSKVPSNEDTEEREFTETRMNRHAMRQRI